MEKDGELRGKLRGKLGRLLEDITGGVVCSLDDLGIVPNPRSVLIHGPLRLLLDGEWMDLSLLQGAIRLAQSDIQRAAQVAQRERFVAVRFVAAEAGPPRAVIRYDQSVVFRRIDSRSHLHKSSQRCRVRDVDVSPVLNRREMVLLDME